jgi:hypothetical protein
VARFSADDGATTVLVALTLPVLLALAATGFATAVLAGGERELQRAADAGALAAAARLPLTDPASAADLLPAVTDVRSVACAVTGDNLGAAALTLAFAAAPACEVALEPDDPSLLAELQAAHPALQDAASLLAPLGLSPSALVPAVATPRLRVRASDAFSPPLLQLVAPDRDGVDLVASSLARRRLKNAVLVPILEVPGTCPVTLETDLGSVTVDVDLDVHVADATSISDLASAITDCRIDLNPVLAESGAHVFDALVEVGARLDELGLPGSRVVDALLLDLRDLYDPTSPAATQNEVLANAVTVDDDVLVILVGVTDATAVPVLDAMPILARDLAGLLDGDPTVEELLTAGRALSEAQGIFRASLYS